MRPFSYLTAATIAAIVMPSPSLARPAERSVRVAYVDLDLSTKDGRAQFNRRLANAVRQVCPAADRFDLLGTHASRACAADTHARLKPAVASAIRERGVVVASTSQDRAIAR